MADMIYGTEKKKRALKKVVPRNRDNRKKMMHRKLLLNMRRNLFTVQ